MTYGLPGSRKAVEGVGLALGVTFPSDYIDFMVDSNGAEGRIGDSGYLAIWSIEDLVSLNEAYSVEEFAPGLVLFGSDGGDTGYAFQSNTVRIVEVPFIGMDLSEAKVIGSGFVQFLRYLHDL